ncbi:MAG: BadF/BadG/BcrA/BcrD ATPase family protein [Vulcanimicrobiaceae bacterium]
MRLYAGIDGGQSSTTAVIAGDAGTVLGTGRAGPADEVGAGPQSTRTHDAFGAALESALSQAGLPATSSFESVTAALSGYDGRIRGRMPSVNAKTFHIVHDSVAAHAGAFAGTPGVVVIGGTGSVAYGTNDSGESVRLGGWGYLFGDAGSGFWIGRRSLERAMRDEDAGLRGTLSAELLRYYGRGSLHEIARAFYGGDIERRKIAAFAPRAFALARQGESDAREIVRQAADALAALAALCARRLHGKVRVIGYPVPVAFAGGLTADAGFLEAIQRQLRARLPEAHWRKPQEGGAYGALLLAYRMASAQP